MTSASDHPLLEPLIRRELIRPLSARSLIGSTLLGSHPPRLPGALLVAFAQEFGIAAGTTRVALSRMVERGELTNDDGVYALAGDLVQRQSRQDRARTSTLGREAGAWDGQWFQAVVVASGRDPAGRSLLRTAFGRLGFAERREGVWMRPATMPSPPQLDGSIADQVEWYRVAPLEQARGQELAASLFPLATWSEDAGALVRALRATTSALESASDLPVAVPFLVAAAALRHLAKDPLLPPELLPADWPGLDLRSAYDELDHLHSAQLRSFFSAVAT